MNKEAENVHYSYKGEIEKGNPRNLPVGPGAELELLRRFYDAVLSMEIANVNFNLTKEHIYSYRKATDDCSEFYVGPQARVFDEDGKRSEEF